MRPSEWLLTGKNEKGGVSLIAKWEFVKIKLVGSSVPTSVSPATGDLNSLTIAPGTNKEGVIAVELRKAIGSGKSRDMLETRFFLHVKNVDGKAEINLEDEWFPSADRLGHIIGDEIEVNINGNWYTTDEYYDPNFKYENIRKTGKSFVSNGGVLLCQYLNRDIDIQAVIGAVQEIAEEKSVLVEAAELRKRVSTLESYLKASETERANLMDGLAKAKKIINEKLLLEKKLLTCLGTIEALEKKEGETYLASVLRWEGDTLRLLREFRKKYDKL